MNTVAKAKSERSCAETVCRESHPHPLFFLRAKASCFTYLAPPTLGSCGSCQAKCSLGEEFIRKTICDLG